MGFPIFLFVDPSSGTRPSKYASQKRKDPDARVRAHWWDERGGWGEEEVLFRC